MRRIGSAEISPAKSVVAGDANARMAFGLPKRKDRAGGVLENGHPAEVHYVECGCMHWAASLSGFSHRLIGIFNCNIKHPVRRHALCALVLAQGVSGSGIAA